MWRRSFGIVQDGVWLVFFIRQFRVGMRFVLLGVIGDFCLLLVLVGVLVWCFVGYLQEFSKRFFGRTGIVQFYFGLVGLFGCVFYFSSFVMKSLIWTVFRGCVVLVEVFIGRCFDVVERQVDGFMSSGGRGYIVGLQQREVGGVGWIFIFWGVDGRLKIQRYRYGLEVEIDRVLLQSFKFLQYRSD